MQRAPTLRPARDLNAVAKTLRHVYPPVHDLSPAIARALETLAHQELRAAAPMPREFAPAA